MGTKDLPPIDPEKWYYTTVRVYQGPFPDPCDPRNFVQETTCCQLGEIILAFYDLGLECTPGFELCVWSGFSVQELVKVEGEYDNFQDCVDEHF